MNILVCLKQTFGTEEKIAIQNGVIQEDGVEFVINPYDEFAVEEALRIKESIGADVTVVSVGPARAESALRTALAMGADRAVLIEENDGAFDEHSVSKILAAFARREKYDLILVGNMTVDYGGAQTGPRLAEELDIPHVTTAIKLTIQDGAVIVEKDAEGDVHTVETTLPVLITTQQGLNEPRYPTLPNIMKAKKKPIERLSLADLGLSADEIAAKTAAVDQFLPPAKKAGKKLSGELADQARELVRLLREEAKII